MGRLILVKHSLPVIDPDTPGSAWRLGPEGRRRCVLLAKLLARLDPTVVVASTEPKAAETAALLAADLDLDVSYDHRLREHDREAAGWLDQADFDAAIARLFAEPESTILGRESAVEAERRFAAGVDAALDGGIDRSPVVVAHGTVISLFVSARTGLDPLPLWRRLGLPSFVALTVPGFRLEREVATIVPSEGHAATATGR